MRFVSGLAAVSVLFFAAAGFQSPAVAATFNVTDVAGLRSALLTAATNGEDDVIVLAAGTYATGGTTFTFVTNETYSLTLLGASGTTRSEVVLDGGGTSQVLNFGCVGSCPSMITLQELTVQNGKAEVSGGGISGSTITVTNSTFSNNTWASGYGGAISGGTVTVTNSSFSGNSATSGGAIHGNGFVTVTNSTFSGNSGASGGAISGGTVTATNSTFSNNTASGSGGAISGTALGMRIPGTVTVANSTFSNNTAAMDGGAIVVTTGIAGGEVAVAVTDSTFSNNTASGSGGAISGGGISASTITVTNSTFSNNTASGSGGAISGGDVRVTNSTFSNNMMSGSGTVKGGAISGRTVTVTNSTFSNNTASGSGGAISGSGSGANTVTGSTFNNNATTSAVYGDGGAISGSGSWTIDKSTFSGNLALGNGGAISANGTVTNSLFSNNTADENGGAIYTAQSVVNSTFSGNSAVASGAAIYLSSASIINSVFYGHSTPAIYATSAYNLYKNLIDTSTGIAGSTPLMGGNVGPGTTSPFVDAVNGNFRLAAGSLAIDTGLDPDSTTFANLVGSSVTDIRNRLRTDLDGNPRPAPGTAVDIGAYEFGSISVIPISERQVLLDIYNSTNGANWTNNTGWNGPVGTECTWNGVYCDDTQSHVIALRLLVNGATPNHGGNHLVGTLPSLSGLTALQTLDVHNYSFNASYTNQLAGSIPSLSGLTALQYVDVSSNKMTGSIPSLSGLAALQYFDVSYNQLSGSIPPLSGLTALGIFLVDDNLLSGPVPAPPPSLTAGRSYLCHNSLVSSGNPPIDAAWVTATGTNWLACQTGGGTAGTSTITGVSRNYGSATISFTTPAQFTSYTVTCTAAGQTAQTASGTNSPITVQGLTGGVPYSCVVTASDGITITAPSAAIPVNIPSVAPMMMKLLFD